MTKKLVCGCGGLCDSGHPCPMGKYVDEPDDHGQEQCGTCGREFLRVCMLQVTTSGIYLCKKCYYDDPIRSDDGLWIDDSESDEEE